MSKQTLASPHRAKRQLSDRRYLGFGHDGCAEFPPVTSQPRTQNGDGAAESNCWLANEDVLVATTRSPAGQPVPVAWVQNAIDRLEALGEIEISVYSVGHRSAFVGAVLRELPGAEIVGRYNNYNPLLLGLILERATRQPVAGYMSSRLWRPLGAEADASWSLDSRQSGFEKMESGINARARDFARFGLLMLEDGRRGGRQVVSREWVRKSTSAAALDDPADFYGAMWWVDRQPGARRDPFFARGKYGQMIAVVPNQDLVFVRLGSHDAGVDWQEFLLDLAAWMPLAK